jgi:hypothetical protein
VSETLTFTSLRSDISKYVDRGKTSDDSEIYDQIPRIINMVERIIATDLKVQGSERTLTDALVDGTSVYAKPERWRETISMQIITSGARSTLQARDYRYCRAYWPDESQTATPLFYADHGLDHWLIAPTPDAAYGWEVKAWLMPALLDDSNQTNWLTDGAPQLLLAGCLQETARLLKHSGQVASFGAEYARHLGSIKGEDVKKITDASAKREGA